MTLILMKILMMYNHLKNVNELMLKTYLMKIIHQIYEDQQGYNEKNIDFQYHSYGIQMWHSIVIKGVSAASEHQILLQDAHIYLKLHWTLIKVIAVSKPVGSGFD